MIKRSLIALSALALLGGGCLFGQKPAEPEWVEPEKPEGIAGEIMGNWKIRSAKLPGSSTKEVSDMLFLISFDGKKMNGNICNSMSGEYTINGTVLKAPTVISTKKFCQGDAGLVETSFLSGLPSGFEVATGVRMITLKSGDTTFVLDRE